MTAHISPQPDAPATAGPESGPSLLKYSLIHPPLLAALAEAGHGSQVLLADGNYAFTTIRPPHAPVIYLNLRPGMLRVTDVLEPILDAVNIESAAVMDASDGAPVPAHDTYRAMLGDQVPVENLERFAFYDAVRAPSVAFVVATGDQALYANLLLTLGVR